jgi:hypothetical protein
MWAITVKASAKLASNLAVHIHVTRPLSGPEPSAGADAAASSTGFSAAL